MEEAHCSQSGTIMLFYGRTHIISIPKYSLVSPGPKHRSATNFSHREISSVPLCALSYSTVPLGLIYHKLKFIFIPCIFVYPVQTSYVEPV